MSVRYGLLSPRASFFRIVSSVLDATGVSPERVHLIWNSFSHELLLTIDIIFSTLFQCLICYQATMVLSSLYHTFECHSSVEVSRACFALDILGITLGLMATYLSGIYYAFWCEPGWRDFYLCTVGGIFLLATSTHFAPGKAVIDLVCTQLGGGGRSSACKCVQGVTALRGL